MRQVSLSRASVYDDGSCALDESYVVMFERRRLERRHLAAKCDLGKTGGCRAWPVWRCDGCHHLMCGVHVARREDRVVCRTCGQRPVALRRRRADRRAVRRLAVTAEEIPGS